MRQLMGMVTDFQRVPRAVGRGMALGVLTLWALAAPAGVTVLHSFNDVDGSYPMGSLTGFAGKLYGMASDGGAGSRGVVFSIGLAGEDFTILHEFAGGVSDGESPTVGAMVELNGRLYGVTSKGGDNNVGTIFRIDPDGTGFTLLHEFSNAAGYTPRGQLCLHGGNLFGTTQNGGAGSSGTIYRIAPDGTGYVTLHEFSGAPDDGSEPFGMTLTSVGPLLFGATLYGGADDLGTLFSIAGDGTGYTVRHAFAGAADGQNPYCTLAAFSGVLYGVAHNGGSSSDGTLFRLVGAQPLEVLHHFTGGGGDGQYPYGSLVLRPGRILGMTTEGGDADRGTLYSTSLDGSDVQLLEEFAGLPGPDRPTGGPMFYGQRLYALTYYGGENNRGCIFTWYDHTVRFATDGTPGCSLSGETVQTLLAGADCTAVEAVAAPGYAFIGWSGDHVGTDNPLTLTTVTGDMAVTANFTELVPVTLAVLPESSGTTDPVPGPRLVPLGQPVAVAATPAEGYHFVRWLVPTGDVTVANPFAASTSITVNAGGGATVAARFEINAYRVEFGTDGTAGATLAGDLVQTVTHGSDCTAVSLATIPENLDFTGWSGDHVGMEDPLTLTNVTSDLAVTANFGRQFAYGSTFQVDAADVDGLPDPGAEFLVKPKVFAVYFDPVKDPDGEKPKKATAKVLDKVTIAGKNPLEVEWRKKVKLYSQSLFKAALKVGQDADAWLAEEGHQEPLALDVRLSSKELAEESVYAAQLMPPEITGMEDNGDGTLTITGRHFGTKKPKVWREYLDDEVVKCQKCKVLAPADLTLTDANGKAACMDAASDRSQVVIELPAKDPGGLNGFLVLDNGVGLATWMLD